MYKLIVWDGNYYLLDGVECSIPPLMTISCKNFSYSGSEVKVIKTSKELKEVGIV